MDEPQGTWVVTPSLHVGTYTCVPSVRVDTVEDAVAVMDSRRSALVSTWEAAGAVLRALGLDEATVADRLHFAQTGTILGVPAR